jgi:hypothetical protein
MSRQSTLALYALGYVCLLLLVTWMAHTTWVDNRSAHVDLKISDVLKVVVLFGWYLIILASVRIEWPKSLAAMFTAVSFVLSSSTGELLSPECLVQASISSSSSSSVSQQGIPQALMRHIIYVLLPLVTMVAVVLLHLAAWCVYDLYRRCFSKSAAPRLVSAKQFMEGRIRVIVMVVLFFFYPSLLRVCLSMFACCPLDVAGQAGTGSMYAAANATYGYWVYDMQQACWQGWHLRWALGLGVGGMVFCLALPAAVAWWLISNKGQDL